MCQFCQFRAPRREESDIFPTGGAAIPGVVGCVGIQHPPNQGGRVCANVREHERACILRFERTDQLSQIGGCRTVISSVRFP
jgi:hypothetical protein